MSKENLKLALWAGLGLLGIMAGIAGYWLLAGLLSGVGLCWLCLDGGESPRRE